MASDSESETIGGKMHCSRKARCMLLAVCVVIIMGSLSIYLKMFKDILGQHGMPKTFRTDGKKNGAVLEMKNVSDRIRNDKAILEPVSTALNQQPPPRNEALIVGHPREGKGFLTIGIMYNSQPPKSKRNINRTLQSLIKNIPPSERSAVTIVVLTSVLDTAARQEAREVVSSFGEHVQSGLIRLIETPKSFYSPDLQKLEGKLMEQVKRNNDAAFLFTYAKDKSEYFLQLSDNVKSTPNFVSNIRQYIKQQSGKYWVALEFIPGGFSGKLVRADARDIRQLIHLFSEYSKDQTTEDLFKHFKSLNVQRETFIRKPSLFVFW